MKLGIISLGCAKNLYDSEMMLGLLNNQIVITNSLSQSDIILINTCGFINSAKEEAIDTILEMLEYKKEGKKIVVTGCLVERYLDELKKELPEVDLFIPLRDYKNFGKIFSSFTNINLSSDSLSPTMRLLTTPKHWAYVRISDGCDNRCTYCAIPLIRKGHVSRKMEDILIEAKGLEEKGIKEIVLISQDTTRYGRDLNNDISLLPTLLKTLVEDYNFEFIRFLYGYPDEVSDELLYTIAKYPKITPYFDIPIQHASDKILKAMNRRGNQVLLKNLFIKIRKILPEAIIRTTVIVGFPSETEEDFIELKEFIKEVRFDRLGAFTYSIEEDTPSATFPNQIDEQVKIKRYHELMEIQEDISLQKNKEHIGKEYKAIIDKYDPLKKVYYARSYAFAPDDVDGKIFLYCESSLEIGSIVQIRINNALAHDLIAQLV